MEETLVWTWLFKLLAMAANRVRLGIEGRVVFGVSLTRRPA